MNNSELDLQFYKAFNKDLSHLNNDDLMSHYYNYGYYEKRICSYDNFFVKYPEYKNDIYRYLNEDLINLTDIDLMNHYTDNIKEIYNSFK